MKIHPLWKILSLSILLALSPSTPSTGRIEKDISLLIQKGQCPGASWGIYAFDIRRRSVVVSISPDKLLIPASNMKLLTTAAAIKILGPGWRYKTRLLCSGEKKDGILFGDLIVKGSGDPSIPLKALESLASAVREKGIKRIEGSIVADPFCFDLEGYGPGWAKDYEMKWYAPKVSGLTINEGCLDIVFMSGNEIGSDTAMKILPRTKILRIENRVKTSVPNSVPDINVRRYGDKIVAYGTIPYGRSYKISISVDDPPLFFADLLLQTLKEAGVEVAGKATVGRARGSEEEIATWRSPPLVEIIKMMNERSINIYAEQIFKTCGYKTYGIGTFETGSMAVYSALKEIGISEDTAGIADGSGLSRKNLLSPRQIVKLLISMAKEEDFVKSLPRSGEEGSLKDRMKSLRGLVAAKTGHLNNISALSGYILDKNGKPVVAFSIMVNNFIKDIGMADKIEDEIVEILAKTTRTK